VNARPASASCRPRDLGSRAFAFGRSGPNLPGGWLRDCYDGSKPDRNAWHALIEAAVLSRPLRRIAKSPTRRMITTHGDVPTLAAIKWSINAAEAVLSENDRRRERCSAFAFSFRYDVR
jgi:hypothetical protein